MRFKFGTEIPYIYCVRHTLPTQYETNNRADLYTAWNVGMAVWQVSESDCRQWRRRPRCPQPLPVRLHPQFVPLFVTGLPVRDNTPNLLPPLVFFATPDGRTDTQTFIYSHFYSGQEILGGRGSPPKSFPRHVAKSRPMCPQVQHLNREETGGVADDSKLLYPG